MLGYNGVEKRNSAQVSGPMVALLGGQPNDAAVRADGCSPTAVLADRQNIMKAALRPCNRDFQLVLRLPQNKTAMNAPTAIPEQAMAPIRDIVSGGDAERPVDSFDGAMLTEVEQPSKLAVDGPVEQLQLSTAEEPVVEDVGARSPGKAQGGGEEEDSAEAPSWAGIAAARDEASRTRHAMRVAARAALGLDVPMRDPTPRGFRLRWMNILPRPTQALASPSERHCAQEEMEVPTAEQADLEMDGVKLPREERDGGAEEAGARQDSDTEALQTPGSEETAAPEHSSLQQSAGSMRSICKSNLKGTPGVRSATPIEGVPERAWRSATKTPFPAALSATGSATTSAERPVTPMEGVLERAWPPPGTQTTARLGRARRVSVGWAASPLPGEQLQEFWPQGSPQVVRGRNTAPYVSPLPAVFGPGSGLGATSGGPSSTSGVSSPASSDDGCFADEDADCDTIDSLQPAAGEGSPALPAASIPAAQSPLPQIANRQEAKGASAHSPAASEGQQQNFPSPESTQGEAAVHAQEDAQEDNMGVEDSAPQEEGEPQAAPAEGADGNRKRPRTTEINQRLKKMYRQRKSLAGQGMQSDDGRRRSTRQRHRPLEWWRQESKIYKREFRSLPTVDHLTTHTPDGMWKTVGRDTYNRKITSKKA